ncbi:VanW family protein [Flavobacterium sp.]|uniref:VanW family protein n=1 Tax=Flavobacterium sp. TaxID=239 RepID=UPI003D6A5FB1
MKLKSLIPKKVKLKAQLFRRFLLDRKTAFAGKQPIEIEFKNAISTQQEIKNGLFFENKLHNLTVASCKIETIVVMPNQFFSFWKIIGEPNERNNFKKGRNIVNGIVSEEIGGGLCQLSSIIYFTALKTDLQITERYNHSLDIYKEEDRFTPLGADATVVYGYKDLRIKNTFSFPIKFSFTFEENFISCHLLSTEKVNESELHFIRNYKGETIEVSTTKNSNHYCFSIYKKLN